MASPVFDWGVPGVYLPPPPSCNSLPTTPPPLGNLHFHPVDAYNLHHNLGVTIIDRQHDVSAKEFFPGFHQLYSALSPG
ncbi:hypothetical protein C8J57DRAFT_1500395 [Mycena rebaudengoi]|nr:hypothetical protein C8J57DRAFT_1500395 [Mycena rebaudengoi]